jgi:MFS family permease
MIPFTALLAGFILSQFYRAFLAVIASNLTRDMGLGPAELGNLSAILFAVFAVAQFPVGLALDRIGARWTVSSMLLLAAAGGALFAAAQSYGVMLLAMAMIGLGCSSALMGGIFIIGRTSTPARFALLASLFGGSGALGSLLAATPLAYAVEQAGWRASLAGVAALTALVALGIATVLRDPPRLERPNASGTLLGDMARILGTRALWPMLPLVLVSYAVIIAERSLWVGAYFGEVHGLEAIARGNAALALAFALAFGGLAYGPFERFLQSPKRAVTAGSLLAGGCFLVLYFWQGIGPAGGLLLLVIAGFSGSTYVILMSHGRRFFPDHLLGRGVTFLNFVFIAGAGMMQNFSGAFVQASRDAGMPATQIYGQLHGAFGLVLLLALLIYLFSPERPAKA